MSVPDRFAGAMDRAAGVLPPPVRRVVDGRLLGFALINGSTFSLDLILLTTLHGGLHWPLPLAITTSYLTAFAVSYALNRVFNFRSRGAVGGQLAVYAVVVGLNYLVWILGVGDGLTQLGVDYRLARVAAGCCEAVYMYGAMRWVVFRDTGKTSELTSVD
jgi:putative flippase GtrA